MPLGDSYHGTLPGIEAVVENTEKKLNWGREDQYVEAPNFDIDGASRDSGHTADTTILRPGLILGRLTANGQLTEWDPTASDGSEEVYGILDCEVKMQYLGSNKDKNAKVFYAGNLKAEAVLVPGQASHGLDGQDYEWAFKQQVAGKFLLDTGDLRAFGSKILAKTADYTVLDSDCNTIFTNKGDADAINFTLPSAEKLGLRYGFYVAADQSLTVTAGTADTMIVFNDAAADSVALSTTGDKLGGYFEVYGDGALWMVRPSVWGDGVITQTVTIAT